MAEVLFSKAGRGYDRGEVDAFLVEMNRGFSEKEASLRDEIKSLTVSLFEANRLLEEKEAEYQAKEQELSAALQRKEEECSSLQATIGQRLIVADDRAEGILRDAEARAEVILADANAEAERIRSEAVRKASSEAEHILAETDRQCSAIRWAIADLSGRLASVRNSAEKTGEMMNEAAETVRKRLDEEGFRSSARPE